MVEVASEGENCLANQAKPYSPQDSAVNQFLAKVKGNYKQLSSEKLVEY
jgi:hypothetical protein